MIGPCAKQTVTATIVTPCGDRFVSTNYCLQAQTECPRKGMVTGTGYELCRSVCQQPSHAEVNVVRLAGEYARGATLFIEGHTYACEPCLEAARKAGIVEVVIGSPDRIEAGDVKRLEEGLRQIDRIAVEIDTSDGSCTCDISVIIAYLLSGKTWDGKTPDAAGSKGLVEGAFGGEATIRPPAAR